MTPREFVEVVVVPTVREYLADRGDLRRAYVACIVTDHVTEHIAFATGEQKEKVRSKIISVSGPSFAVVRGIAIARKHPESASARRFNAGSEVIVDFQKIYSASVVPLGTRVTAAHDSIDHGPLLCVEHEGELRTVDFCLAVVLNAYLRTYPQHLGAIDMQWMRNLFSQGKHP